METSGAGLWLKNVVSCSGLQLSELEALNAELEDANTQLEAVALAAGAQRDVARSEAGQAMVNCCLVD